MVNYTESYHQAIHGHSGKVDEKHWEEQDLQLMDAFKSHQGECAQAVTYSACWPLLTPFLGT